MNVLYTATITTMTICTIRIVTTKAFAIALPSADWPSLVRLASPVPLEQRGGLT